MDIKPIHKFNGGKGATLCHKCSVIISEGLTEDLYCEKCEQKQTLIDMMQDDEKLGLYDEPKQETLEEAAEIKFNVFQKENPIVPKNHIQPFKLGFINGAKWQQEPEQFFSDDRVKTLEKSIEYLLKRQERSYSEEEVIKILYQFHYDLVNSNFDTKEEWFERFKKK